MKSSGRWRINSLDNDVVCSLQDEDILKVCCGCLRGGGGHSAWMERLHWVQHRCRHLLGGDSGRGCYSAPNGLPNKNFPETHSSPQRVSGKRRTVFARHGPHQQEYPVLSKSYKGNAIRTTKYSLLTFLPMNLFQQFHRSDSHLCK